MPRKAKSHKRRHPPPRESRPSARERGYTWQWSQYARGFLVRNPVCVMCGQKAEHVDHIRPVSGPDDPGFWVESGLQALCHGCHNRKTKRDQRQ